MSLTGPTSSHSIAFMIDGNKEETGYKENDNCIYCAINAYWGAPGI